MILDEPLRKEIAREITAALRGARVRRVHQPLPERLVLTFRVRGDGRRLLLSADPRRARAHLTSRRHPNPPAAPPFCMLARKHLEGRPFLDATAEPGAPALHFRFGPRSPAEEDGTVLTLEMTGHASTVLLCAERDGERTILGLLRPLPAARRDLAPGAPYRPPRRPGRLDPARATPAEVLEGVRRLREGRRGRADDDPARLLSRLFEGVGRHVAAEALARAGMGGDVPEPLDERGAGAILASLRDLLDRPPDPRLLPGREGGPGVLLPFPLAATGRSGEPAGNLSEALDALCGEQEEILALEARRARTLRLLGRLIEHRERKLERQRGDLLSAREGERWRRRGDLLLAQPAPGRRGLTRIEVVDVFDPGGAMLQVDLDPALSLTENAARLYARARKAARAVGVLGRVVAQGEIELRHLREQALQAAQAKSADTLRAIEETASGRPAPRRAAPARGKTGKGGRGRGGAGGALAKGRAPAEPEPRRFLFSGWEMLVGRHGRDNDRLVTRIGRPSDLWFHARNVPGAHVLLRCPPSKRPPEDAVAAAARLAAYFSGARDERHAEVIVAPLSQVRKPRGAPPGQVVVGRSRTLGVPGTLPEMLDPPPAARSGSAGGPRGRK